MQIVGLLQQHNLVPPTPLVSARVLREDVDCWMEVQVFILSNKCVFFNKICC